MKFKPLPLASLVSAFFALSACTAVQTHEETLVHQTSTAEKTQAALNQLHEPMNAIQPNGALVTERPWVDTKPIPIKQHLPDVFSKINVVTINEPFPTPIESVLAKMSAQTGLAMSFENDIVDSGPGGGGGRTAPVIDTAANTQTPQVIDLTGLSIQGGGATNDVRIAVSYQGSVQGMLDATANAMKASWRYDEASQRVIFFRYLTKSFRLNMVPGSVENSSSVSASSSGGTSGGAQAQSKFGGTLSIWESINDAMKTMMSSRGSFNVSESTGVITVRDVPDVVSRVEAFIDKMNDGFSKQVTVDVKIYRVQNTLTDIRGINWNLVFQQAGLGMSVVTPRPDTVGLASAILSVPDTAVGSAQKWIGTDFFLDSLSKIGEASVVTSTTVQTVNNQPAPIRIGRKLAYLRESTQSSTANVGTTVTLTPGEVDVGLAMQIVPNIQDNGRDMLMQIMMTLSTLDEMKTFTSGGSSIQLPQISSRDFMQRVNLSSGQTLVLAGFESVEGNTQRSGLVDAQAWPLGGLRDQQLQKDSIVIVITPVVTSRKNTL